MKLVLKYSFGDGYTYWADVDEPFEYESKEKAAYDLLVEWEKWRKAVDEAGDQYVSSDIVFAGKEINLNHFTSHIEKKHSKRNIEYTPEFNEPEILELEEWWEKYKV